MITSLSIALALTLVALYFTSRKVIQQAKVIGGYERMVRELQSAIERQKKQLNIASQPHSSPPSIIDSMSNGKL